MRKKEVGLKKVNIVFIKELNLGLAFMAEQIHIHKLMLQRDKVEIMKHIDFFLDRYKMEEFFFIDPDYHIILEDDFGQLSINDILQKGIKPP